MRLRFIFPVIALLSGCAREACVGTCDKILSKTYCSISNADTAMSPIVAIDDYCVPQCEAAYEVDGDIGDYDPNTPVPRDTLVVLENRAQVKAWADCVDDASCDALREGYCAPTFFR